MQDFEVKRGHGKTLEDGGLKSLMEEEFGEITDEGTVMVASFKATFYIYHNGGLVKRYTPISSSSGL